MPFALNTNASPSEISEAINYLLSNFGNGSTVDPVTGQIIAPGGIITGYLYEYMAIKYADSSDGSVNFSNSPTNRLYFGLRNSADASESSNYADYIWYEASGGFGTTKFLWYQTTGGRQLQVAVSVLAPDAGWIQDTGASIDLDIITSGTIPVIVESFVSYFTPPVLQVPRTGNPLTPSFTSVAPALYATDLGQVIPFSDAQTDSGVSFVAGTWRIGNSSTTGYGDISKTNITIGDPTDSGDFALWPVPTAMSGNPAYITVPIRYKNSLGTVSQASVATQQFVFVDPGATGSAGPTVDISGYASFTQNAGGLFTPSTATLSAITTNVTLPTYAWAISGATPTTATTSSVVVTPTSSSTGVAVTLTVNGSNLTGSISKTINMPVVYDGAPGTAGANGVMSAFPTIYIWTGSSSAPTRPSTTSTFTWSTGAYTAPAGWSSQAPSNTTAGNYLWSITIPLNVAATVTTSTLDWTNVSYPIRAIAYNGANGANGTNGTNGANGTDGSATFVVTRTANDSSAPTNAECIAVIGRTPVAGDIVTVSYNSANNAVVYRYITSWTLFQTYITGSLIVQNTITSDKLSVNSLNSITANTGTLTVSGTITANTASISGSTLSGTGAVIYSNGKFGVGNATNSLVWDNSTLTIKGDITGSSNISITGDALFYGQNLSTNSIVIGGFTYFLDYSAYAEALTLPTLNATRVGFYGRAAAQPNVSGGRIGYNVGVVGYGQNFFGSKGVGVVGQGDQTGGYFSGTEYGVIAIGDGISGIGLWVQAGTLKFGNYEIAVPTGSTTTFLRNDGQWVTPPGGGGTGTVTSVSGTGTVSGLTLSGTVTTSGNLTLGGTLSLTSGNVTSALGFTPISYAGNGTWSGGALSMGNGGTGTTSISSGYVKSNGSSLSSVTSIPVADVNLSGANIVAALSGTSGTTSGVSTIAFSGTLTGGAAGTITWTMGSTTAAININVTSDNRLKKNIKDIELGLSFVKQLRPVSYEWNHEAFADKEGLTNFGFIAQEVEPLVGTTTSMVGEIAQGPLAGYKYFSNEGIVAALVASVKELSAEIEALKAQLKA